jgi:hypothetical protein
VAKTVNLGKVRETQLSRRRSIEVELPEWLIRVIDFRIAEANVGVADDAVDLNDVVEWCLVAPITLKDVPAYEAAIPGLTAALSKWLESSTYDPPV